MKSNTKSSPAKARDSRPPRKPAPTIALTDEDYDAVLPAIRADRAARLARNAKLRGNRTCPVWKVIEEDYVLYTSHKADLRIEPVLLEALARWDVDCPERVVWEGTRVAAVIRHRYGDGGGPEVVQMREIAPAIELEAAIAEPTKGDTFERIVRDHDELMILVMARTLGVQRALRRLCLHPTLVAEIVANAAPAPE